MERRRAQSARRGIQATSMKEFTAHLIDAVARLSIFRASCISLSICEDIVWPTQRYLIAGRLITAFTPYKNGMPAAIKQFYIHIVKAVTKIHYY